MIKVNKTIFANDLISLLIQHFMRSFKIFELTKITKVKNPFQIQSRYFFLYKKIKL